MDSREAFSLYILPLAWYTKETVTTDGPGFIDRSFACKSMCNIELHMYSCQIERRLSDRYHTRDMEPVSALNLCSCQKLQDSPMHSTAIIGP